jgi:hypothetical protein
MLAALKFFLGQDEAASREEGEQHSAWPMTDCSPANAVVAGVTGLPQLGQGGLQG